MTSKRCDGFKVLTFKVKESSSTEHYIFVKEHSVREKNIMKPSDKTLFINGVPPFVTEVMLKEMFSQFGEIKNVYIHSNPDPGVPPVPTSKFFKEHPPVMGYKVAYVVFEKSISVERVMAVEANEKLLLMEEKIAIPFGIPKWCKEYNERFIIPGELQAEINAFMEKYDEEAEEKQRRLKEVTEPDNEGWVTVTKKSRKPGFARKESVHKKIMQKEQIKKKKKQLLNFYRFQIRETKMQELVKLREKYEEDKKKIEILKKSRKFKPF